ncbi:DUF397 domain-containing protein [Streptomyces sannanensis]|uniref:DUF397 domain-containing protein n=1 Tax=Streptomyces sannanensis TaxID=285536 RepID=A0ABP6SGF0_9ACTN
MNDSLKWRKSSYSSGKNDMCVEVAHTPDGRIAIRDSKDPHTILHFTHHEWDAFMKGARSGEFDFSS